MERLFRIRMRRGRALLVASTDGAAAESASEGEEVVVAEETAAFLVRGRAAEVIDVIEPASSGAAGVETNSSEDSPISAKGDTFTPPRRLPTRIPRSR